MKYTLLLIIAVANLCYGQFDIDQAFMAYKSTDGSEPTIEQRGRMLNWVDNNKVCLDTCTTVKTKMYLAHKIASILYVLDEPKDTIIKYLEIAKETSHFRTCRMLIDLDKNFADSNMKIYQGIYFAKDNSKDWWDNFVADCYSEYDSLELQMSKKNSKSIQKGENSKYVYSLKIIKDRDQKYRKDYELEETFQNEKQWKLDEINRMEMDSLYKLYGFPTIEKVGTDGFENAWLVLHHSSDCEWNKVWFEIYIKEYLKSKIAPGFIHLTMSRFFNPKNGFCDKLESKDFINYLNNKYTADVATKFDYINYLEK